MKTPRRPLLVELLEDRLVPAGNPVIDNLTGGTVLLGETANITFNFRNASLTDNGYSPFIEVYVDTSGVDGATSLPTDGFGTPTVTIGGLTLAPIQTVNLTGAGQTFTNNFTGQSRTAIAGYGNRDTVFIYQLPFGSFTPGQFTGATVSIPTSEYADLGVGLNLSVIGGFRDDDPVAPINPNYSTLVATTTVTPELWRLTKRYLGPENETATGPNYLRDWILEVDVAPSQTLTNLQIADLLDDTMQWTGAANVVMRANGAVVATNIAGTSTATTTIPGGTVIGDFGPLTIGGGLAVDASLQLEFFVPRDDRAGVEILEQPTPPLPNPAGGEDRQTRTNTGSAQANWTPTDFTDNGRDGPAQLVTKPAPDNGAQPLEEHSVAVQKHVEIVDPLDPTGPAIGGQVIPGQTLLRYTIDFQVSDYYAVNNLIIQDVLGDGQRLYIPSAQFAPTLTVQNPWTSSGTRVTLGTSGAFTGNNTIDYERNYTIRTDTDSDPSAGVEGYADVGPSGGIYNLLAPNVHPLGGETTLTFHISDELIARGLASGNGMNGVLVGGEIDPATNLGDPQNLYTPPAGPAQGTITFWVIAKREYSNNFPSGDNSVDQGDTLGNSATVRGQHLDPHDLTDGTPTPLPGPTFGTDETGSSLLINRGVQTKTVYAINGTVIPTQTPADTVFSTQAGDRVTYKLTYTLPISRFEDLSILDIPPLPVMPVGAGPYTFSSTFTGMYNAYSIQAAPDDTFFSTFPGFVGPTITTDQTTNTITMSFGDFDDPQARPTQISLLITLPIGTDPFIGDLFLTNQERVNEGNTFLGASTVEDLRRFQLVQPTLTIDKGVVAVDNTFVNTIGNPFTAPGIVPNAPTVSSFAGVIDTPTEADDIGNLNATGLDASDRARFAIVAQNTGRGDAYDVVIDDFLPVEYLRPLTENSFATGVNLTVRRGDGTLLTDRAQVDGFAKVATTSALAGWSFTAGAGTPVGDQFSIAATSVSIDGISLFAGDRVLVKNETTPSRNGVYELDFVGANAILTRVTDFDDGTDFAAGYRVAIFGGDTFGDHWFITTTANAPDTWGDQGVVGAGANSQGGYYYAYDVATRHFQVNLTDNYSFVNANYTQGNYNVPGSADFDVDLSPDSRSGGLSRGEYASTVSPTGAGTAITNGSNTVVITYDIVLGDTTTDNDPAAGTQATPVRPRSTYVNTATITNFGSSQGGGDHTDPTVTTNGFEPTDNATVTTRDPQAVKTLISTEVNEPGNNSSAGAGAQATIGEFITYQVTVTVPEGFMPTARIIDTLDPGLAFVDIQSVTSSAALTSTTGLTQAAIQTNMVVSANGAQAGGVVTFNLGNLSNSDFDNLAAETITITYRAVVLNTAANQQGQQRSNSVVVSWVNSAAATVSTTPVSAPVVTIVEPTVTTAKTVRNVSENTPAAPNFTERVHADAGDTIRYQIVLTATGTTAFDLVFSDPLPVQLGTPSIASVTSSGTVRINGSAGTVTASDFLLSGSTLTLNPASNIDMVAGSTITIEIQGTWSGASGQVIVNNADTFWSSLDGDRTAARSTFNPSSVERDGVTPTSGLLGQGALNDYHTTDPAEVESPPLVHKSIIATSEASTTPGSITAPGVVNGVDVAIGEIVRYRGYVSIPEGDSSNFQIQDFIQPGMMFLNDGTARFAFIANGPTTRITSAGVGNVGALSGGGVTGAAPELIALPSLSITGVFGDSNISRDSLGTGIGDTYGDGDDVYFRFGTLTNADRDPAELEFLVFEYNVLVLNTAANQALQTRTNNFAVLVDTDNDLAHVPGYVSVDRDDNANGTFDAGDSSSTATDADNDASDPADVPGLSNTTTVRIVEPNLDLVKSVVTYQVVVTNNGTATAFNTRIQDILPTAPMRLDLNVGSIQIFATSGGVTGGTANHSDAANRMEYDDFTIPVGGSVTIRYTANVTALGVGATLTNTATTDYTSLPGTGTTGNPTGSNTPGASGAGTGERNGQDGPGGALNDYADSDTQQLGAIGNRVWRDDDVDGIQDLGETVGFAGVTATLRRVSDNAIVQTTVTNSSGNYWFNALLPGSYYVEFGNLPLDFFPSPQNQGGVEADDSDVAVPPGPTLPATLTSDPVTLAAGQVNPDVDMGLFPVFSIGNRVWRDVNNNGRLDAPDGLNPGINGVTVRLLDSAGNPAQNAFGSLVPNAVTANGGYYRFDNLAPGDYIVEVVGGAASPLAGLISSPVPGGDPDNNIDSDNNGTGVVIMTGANVRSSAITLALDEPTNETNLGTGDSAHANTHTNLTVDFAFRADNSNTTPPPNPPTPVNEDSPLLFCAGLPSEISINAPNSGSAPFQVTLTAGVGTLKLAGTSGLTFTAGANGSSTMTFQGTASQVNNALSRITYTPPPNFNGTTTLTVTTWEMDLPASFADTNVVNITVAPRNDTPVVVVAPATVTTTMEDIDLAFSTIDLSDPDDPAGTSTVRLTLTASNGRANLVNTSGLNFITANNSATVTVEGTLAALNTAIDTLRFVPNPNFNGAASMTVTLNDLANGGPGALSAGRSISINVTAVNDAPTVTSSRMSFARSGTTATLTGINVTDVDSPSSIITVRLTSATGAMTLSRTTGLTVTGNGSGSVVLTGTAANINAALSGMRYTGAAGSLLIRAEDPTTPSLFNQLTVNIT